MSSDGRSATSGSRLLWSIRKAASWTQPLHESSAPRGARRTRLADVIASQSSRRERERGRGREPRRAPLFVGRIEADLESLPVLARQRSGANVLDRLGLAEPDAGLRPVPERLERQAAIEGVLGARRVVPRAAVALERRERLLGFRVSALLELRLALGEGAPTRADKRGGDEQHVQAHGMSQCKPPSARAASLLRPRTQPSAQESQACRKITCRPPRSARDPAKPFCQAPRARVARGR